MRSIRTKLTSITLIAILVSVLSVGGVSIVSVRHEGQRSSYKEMTLICQNLEKSVDEYLKSISQSVDVISRYANEDLSAMKLQDYHLRSSSPDKDVDRSHLTEEQLQELDQSLSEHVEMIENLFHSVASHTNGLVAYYYRLNPELSDNVKGFFYTKTINAGFSAAELTDLSAFDPEDVNHVGWFYIPQQRKRTSWLPVYKNDNIDMLMTSYVCPLYQSGTFVGVIGMDISYDTLVKRVKDAQVYDSGYACLLSEDGSVIYHPSMEMGTPAQDLFSGQYRDFTANISHAHSKELLPFVVGEEEKRVVFTTLANDMKLLVSAPLDEINASWVQLIHMIILASVLIIVVFMTLMVVTLTHITEPLLRLTDASKRISDGDYDVVLDYKGEDELGILTSSFQQLVNHLKIYIKDLNSKAYRDALTGVKNKGAFDISAHKLDDTIRLSDPLCPVEFALVMLDCNNLKVVNDRLGHDKGDIYLCTACAYICQVFAHSPVFRLGGDEFAVILQKNDYLQRQELVSRFRSGAQAHNAEVENQWQRIDVALGMAVYDAAVDKNVESVLHRADELMYVDKRRSKAGKG